MKKEYLENYASLIVKTGVNLQKNQTLVIFSPVECADFTRLLARIAYHAGAREVVVGWKDELLAKERYLHAAEEVIDEFPEWQRVLFISHARQGAAFVTVSAEDPELLKDITPDRIARAQKARSTAIREYRERLMSNHNSWCVVSIPTAAWAQKVFPGLSEEDAVARLWETIFYTVRVDTQDPVASWDTHKASLKRYQDFLNTHRFRYLHYKNALGTDLKIELPENHLWLGGSDYTHDGVEFVANMPTEEVFTLPKKAGVNGTVMASKPLIYNGNRIDRFSLTFRDGKVVDFQAEEGYETLKNILDSDEGSRYLGEVALVPYDSPISNSGILFYNTLFDENASCHLALGKAYPKCIKNSEGMSKEQLEQAGVNDSLVHEDFMMGTKDLEITGITADGAEVSVFRNGNFAF
jgi:aminopeptidase